MEDGTTGEKVKLADIRCETCPHFDLMSIPRGWCNIYSSVRYRADACNEHPLWKRALAEERKGGGDAKSE